MKGFTSLALAALLVVVAALGASVVGGSDTWLKPGATFSDCATICPEIIVLSAGDFMMGSPENVGKKQERPSHKVTIPEPIAVSKFEVTF